MEGDAILVGRCVQILEVNSDALSVTIFVPRSYDAKYRVRVTRIGKDELRVSRGKPNFRERKFLKLCRTAKQDPKEYWISKRRAK